MQACSHGVYLLEDVSLQEVAKVFWLGDRKNNMEGIGTSVDLLGT